MCFLLTRISEKERINGSKREYQAPDLVKQQGELWFFEKKVYG